MPKSAPPNKTLAKVGPAEHRPEEEIDALVRRARRLDPRLARLIAAYGSLKRDAVKQTLTDFLVEFTKSDNRALD